MEWVAVEIHGQSFMLHQIRKMIGMAILIIRLGSSPDKVVSAFDDIAMRIPRAPGLGLYLKKVCCF